MGGCMTPTQLSYLKISGATPGAAPNSLNPNQVSLSSVVGASAY